MEKRLIYRLEYNEDTSKFFENYDYSADNRKGYITIADGYDDRTYTVFFSYLDGTKHYTVGQIKEKWESFVKMISLIEILFNVNIIKDK
jgi:hypothetical protein